MTMNKKYGWKPDLPDHRDIIYSINRSIQVLPEKVDLRLNCPPVYDQGELGSCTGNAIAAALEYEQIKKKVNKPFIPSRLFIYYNERLLEGTVNQDSGAQIRDGMKTVNLQGACTEKTWPYTVSKFKTKPVAKAYTEGLKYQIKVYSKVNQDLNSLKGCLASGDPFVFGFTVYESFESDAVAKTGIVPMPATTESTLGGHAVLCVGYDNKTQRFTVRNSWGSDWGIKGYFTIPYQYLTNINLSSDFWVIKDIEI